jgi:hypothetical protein
MPSENIKALANNSIELVKHFFANLPEDVKIILPSVFKIEGVWFGNFDDYTIGIFYLSKDELERVNSNINHGLPAFPGFFVSDANKSEKVPIAIKAGGLCSYFASNHTSNMIAFNVCAGASFTVIDHFHELKDLNGQEFKYRVDLAFFLGTFTDERWDKFEPRLLELLHHSLDVWRSLQ